MDRSFLYYFLKELENLQMFALSKEFYDLSLEDCDSGSSSSSSSSRTEGRLF